MIEVTCPYCLYVLSGLEVSNEARWRKHVLGDLDALVCLFDPCDEPDVLYRHSKDWLQHMRKHARRWRCSAKSHGVQTFGSREEFENHMKGSHRKNYTSAQLDLLAERGMRSSGPLFEVCPLCGGKDDAEDDATSGSGSLIDHIVGHLRSLALKSLPPHYAENEDDSSNSHGEESVQSRSTIRNVLKDDNAPLHFTEVQHDYSSWDTDAVDWRYVLEAIPQPQEDDQSPIKKFMAYQTNLSAPDFVLFDPERVSSSGRRLGGGDDSDDYDDYDDMEISSEIGGEQNIIPTYEGFRRHVLRLNPHLRTTNGYLVDRIASQCVDRLNRLMKAKANHLESASQGNCPSGALCLHAMGGAPTPLEGSFIHSEMFPDGIPMPPTTSLPAELECQLCFTAKKLQKPSDWTKHVHEDVQPFTCTWDGCRDPKMYKRKADWVRHENEAHRHLEWWACDVVGCQSFFFRRDGFLQHLVREHHFTEPKVKTRASIRFGEGSSDIMWGQKVMKCHTQTELSPYEEPCRFCGKSFPTWKKLTVHLAKHMEQISLPITKLLEAYRANENGVTEHEADPTPQKFSSLQISAEQNRRYSSTLAAVPLIEPVRDSLPGLDNMGLRDHIDLSIMVSVARSESQAFIIQRDRPMIDHFVRSILPDIFPIYQLTRARHPSISHFVLTSLEKNESFVHCCLMVAAQHYKTITDNQAESIDETILEHNSMLIKILKNQLNRKEDYEQVLQTTLSLIAFQCHIGVYDSSILSVPFREHIQGATSVAHALELPDLVSSSKQPEGLDRLYISMTAWIDILGATMTGSAPYFARIYRERHISMNDTHLGLVDLMGCEDRVMYLISEIACLDMLVMQGLDDADLRQQTTILDNQLDNAKRLHEGARSIDISGSYYLVQLTYIITEAFLAAAKIYLRCLDPNFSPLDCTEQVDQITDFLAYVPNQPKEYDRSLVWVYLVCGSVSVPSSRFRLFFANRIAQLGDAAKLGSFGGLVSLLREIWDPTNLEMQDLLMAPRSVVWRDAMNLLGWDYLLI
ncbi:hypothetical protein F5Y05DRAFT_325333 [Hypoxylon sp. FL0543]|nr:hypothetical protein F5Y05DRAFT_325333 [Hypoxylon sp. FL0543]